MEEKQYSVWVGKKKVPVSEAVFKECVRTRRHERYQRARDREKRLLHYDAWDIEGMNGSEFCVDQEFSTEEKALAAIEAEKIWQHVEKLKDEDQICQMISQGYSEREIAKICGVSKTAIHNRKKYIFEQIKTVLLSEDSENE